VPIIDVTVAAVIAHEERFLLVKERVAGRLVLNQPAGHLENGESLLDAVVRETVEETGFRFVPSGVVGIYLWHCEEGERDFLRVCFTGRATPPSGPVTLDDGIVSVHWLSRSDLLSSGRRLRSPLVMRCIDDYCANVRYPLDCLSHVVDPASARGKLA
jgi:8-oxo-dGTP pyrophosphatase MutT (NUDIX family)